MAPATATASRFTVATVWGIPIRVHPSWLIVFALVTWSLAAGGFPAERPGWPAAAYWVAAAATAALFFASVVVHELGHSWVALRHGLPIRGITLFVFGGVARITREPDSAGAELSIALAGPATSGALALVFALLSVAAAGTEMVAVPLAWLARMNAAIAVFNLLPGFPLDGGRVLRALVWRWRGDWRAATRVAAFTGGLVATGLVGLGILLMLRGDVVGGLWTALIGWFLQSTAAASRVEADIKELLRDVTVDRVMARDCAHIPGNETLAHLAEDQVLGAGRRCFLVADDGRLRGLLTLHEMKSVPRDRWPKVTADEVMAPRDRLTTIGPRESLLIALQKMDDADVAQLPVVEGERLLGLIGREHVLHYLRTRAELGA